MVQEDCYFCFGQPGGCGRCKGSGLKPLSRVDLALISRDVKSVLNNEKIKPRINLRVIEGGKSGK